MESNDGIGSDRDSSLCETRKELVGGDGADERDSFRSPIAKLGRYVIHERIATGGMASVHLSMLTGACGFARVVAIKRLHAHFAQDLEFVAAFLDEARMCSIVRHPNVVPVLDVVASKNELFMVMEYIEGEPLSSLLKVHQQRDQRIPDPIIGAVAAGFLRGLHAAHQATNHHGNPLDIVHRDVSPQNVIVGTDGLARLLDFGVAKAIDRIQSTRIGEIKGKIRYMSPEQAFGESVTHRTDIFSAGVVLWEMLTLQQLVKGDVIAERFAAILLNDIPVPSQIKKDISPEVDGVVMRALAREPDDRYSTALEMAAAVVAVLGEATPCEVGRWVVDHAGGDYSRRCQLVNSMLESGPVLRVSSISMPPSTAEPDRPPSPPVSTYRRWGFTALILIPFLVVVPVVFWVLLSNQEDSHADVARASPSNQDVVPRVEVDVDSAEGADVPAAEEIAPEAEEAGVPKPTKSLLTKKPFKAREAGAKEPTETAPTQPTPVPPPVNCDPPFFISDDGLRRFKPECLR